LLVNEDELLVTPRAEVELADGELGVGGERGSGMRSMGSMGSVGSAAMRAGLDRTSHPSHTGSPDEPGCGVAKGLPGVGERLGVHVLMEDPEPGEIAQLRGEGAMGELVDEAVAHLAQVGESRLTAGQGEVPAAVVGDGRRI